MKALVVDPDSARATGVAEALTGSGATVTVAPTASFALTMLEWNRQDVIISRAQVGDMDGLEFCALVRSDPSTAGVRFVLITSDVSPSQTAQHGLDLVIPDGLIGHAIATRVMHLMRREPSRLPAAPAAEPVPVVASAAEPVPGVTPAAEPVPVVAPAAEPVGVVVPGSAPVVAPAPEPAVAAPADPTRETADVVPRPPARPPARSTPPSLAELDNVGANGATRTFQGVLGELSLEDLANALARGTKTGRLLLVLGSGGGMIAFDGGRIVHAEIGNTTGETAFQALVVAARREHRGKFCFIPSDPRDLANVPKTIDRSVPELLVGAAHAVHEER
jgi:CheY-like chemotaxis protein